MIYFDNSATTKPSAKSVQAMCDAMEHRFANASSLHSAGVAAKGDVDRCRAAVARVLCCKPGEVMITPGGTFGNNLAVHSAVTALKRRGNRIVISSVEHPSVAACARSYEAQGFEVVACNPLSDDFERAIDEKTVLVSCMLVNNETGLILPAGRLRSLIEQKRSPALLHIDAVQAFGKIPVDVSRLRCDYLTVSAHKINGPKGIGALYVRQGVRVLPLTFGGEQENAMLPGTYNSPAAAGFAAAVEELSEQDGRHYDKLYTHFTNRAESVDYMKINVFGRHAHHIINVTFDGYLGENVLHFLEEYGIYTSQGSACSSHSKQKSHALAALGADKRTSDGSLRISFDRNNTIGEIDAFFDALCDLPERLLKYYR